jgi:hypothetical protein
MQCEALITTAMGDAYPPGLSGASARWLARKVLPEQSHGGGVSIPLSIL